MYHNYLMETLSFADMHSLIYTNMYHYCVCLLTIWIIRLDARLCCFVSVLLFLNGGPTCIWSRWL